MEHTKQSPINKFLQKRKIAKTLAISVYETIFDVGVEKTAEKYIIKPEEAIKLIIPIIRKNGETDKFFALVERQKLFLVSDKIEELQTLSTNKLFDMCGNSAKKWEILIAREIWKMKNG